MRNLTKTKVVAVWQSSANIDSHALLKAVAMVFRRRVPLSTQADLTNPDKTLLYERPDDS
jgi:hypothetical protein